MKVKTIIGLYAFLKKDLSKAKVIWVSSQKKIKEGISYLGNILCDNYFTKKAYKINENIFLKHNHNK